jgi:hypothetical protein
VTIELDRRSTIAGCSVYSITGLDSSDLMTVYGALGLCRDELVADINKMYRAEKNNQVSDQQGGFRDRTTNDGAVSYCSDEDILFLSEELRKVVELMFRIKTEPGVF